MPRLHQTKLSPLLTICLVGFFSVSSFSLVSPILSLYAKDFVKATIVEIGVITSAFFVASASIKIPLGIFGGGKRTPLFFAVSLLLLTILPYLYTLTETSTVLALVRAVHGIAFALATTVSLIITPLTVPEHRKNQATALYSLLTGLGLVTGSAIGTLSVAIVDLRSSFYLASLLALPGFVLGFEFIRRLYSIESQWVLLLDRPSELDLRRKLVRVTSNRLFLTAFFACLAYFFAFGAVLAYAPLYLKQQLGLSYFSVAAIFFGCYSSTTLTRLPLGTLVMRYRHGKEIMLFLAEALAAILLSSIPLLADPTLFALVIVLFGISQGVIYPVGAMISTETISPSELVLANSLYLVAWDLGLALGPVLTSTIASSAGLLSAMAVSSALPAASIVPILHILLSKKKNKL